MAVRLQAWLSGIFSAAVAWRLLWYSLWIQYKEGPALLNCPIAIMNVYRKMDWTVITACVDFSVDDIYRWWTFSVSPGGDAYSITHKTIDDLVRHMWKSRFQDAKASLRENCVGRTAVCTWNGWLPYRAPVISMKCPWFDYLIACALLIYFLENKCHMAQDMKYFPSLLKKSSYCEELQREFHFTLCIFASDAGLYIFQWEYINLTPALNYLSWKQKLN
jgi:hypothetical protein